MNKQRYKSRLQDRLFVQSLLEVLDDVFGRTIPSVLKDGSRDELRVPGMIPRSFDRAMKRRRILVGYDESIFAIHDELGIIPGRCG